MFRDSRKSLSEETAIQAVRDLLGRESRTRVVQQRVLQTDEPRVPGLSLPVDFRPSPHSVIVGRGKEPKENMGNKRLRGMATSLLPEYSDATDKRTKSRVVSSIVSIIQDACPEGGAFVKHLKNGQWYVVDDLTAREKVGYVFRDLLSDRYRSSSKSKVARRLSELKRQHNSSDSQSEEIKVCSAEQLQSPCKDEMSLVYHNTQKRRYSKSLRKIMELLWEPGHSVVAEASSVCVKSEGTLFERVTGILETWEEEELVDLDGLLKCPLISSPPMLGYRKTMKK
jgi:hypothetical protein